MNTVVVFGLISILLSSVSLRSYERSKNEKNYNTLAEIKLIPLTTDDRGDSIFGAPDEPIVNIPVDRSQEKPDTSILRKRRNAREQGHPGAVPRSEHRSSHSISSRMRSGADSSTSLHQLSSGLQSRDGSGSKGIRVRRYNSGTLSRPRRYGERRKVKRKRKRKRTPGDGNRGLVGDTASSQVVKSSCVRPPHITNGHVELPTSFSIGSKIVYTCKEGFILKGISTHICKSDGRWSAGKPACVRNDTLASNGDIKEQIDRVTDDLTDAGETSVGKALLLGIVMVVLVLLLLTCHCIKVSSTRRMLRDKHKEVVDEGLEPTQDVPGLIAVSTGLLKKCFCCDSGLPTSFKPHKSRSRLSTTSLRDDNAGDESFEMDIVETPEDTENEYPVYGVSSRTASKNLQNNSLDYKSLMFHKNDNAASKRKPGHRARKLRIEGGFQLVRDKPSTPRSYQEDRIKLIDKRTTSKSKRSMAGSGQVRKTRNHQAVSRATPSSSVTGNQWFLMRSAPTSFPTRNRHRNKNMNTNTGYMESPSRLPLYNASQSSLTYKDYLENARRKRSMYADGLLNDDLVETDVISTANQYNQYNSSDDNLDMYPCNEMDNQGYTTDDRINDWCHHVENDQGGITVPVERADGKTTENETRNGIRIQDDGTQTDSQSGYTYGIFSTTLNINSNNADALTYINRRQYGKDGVKEIDVKENTQTDGCVDRKVSKRHTDREQVNVDKYNSHTSANIEEEIPGTDESNFTEFKRFQRYEGHIDNTGNEIALSDINDLHGLPVFKTESEKIRYVLGEEEPTLSVCTEGPLIDLDSPGDTPRGHTETLPFEDVSSDESKTLTGLAEFEMVSCN